MANGPSLWLTAVILRQAALGDRSTTACNMTHDKRQASWVVCGQTIKTAQLENNRGPPFDTSMFLKGKCVGKATWSVSATRTWETNIKQANICGRFLIGKHEARVKGLCETNKLASSRVKDQSKGQPRNMQLAAKGADKQTKNKCSTNKSTETTKPPSTPVPKNQATLLANGGRGVTPW